MALKKTSINATLFEEGGAQQQHNQTHDVDVESPAVTLRDRRGSNATDAEEDVTQSNAKGKNKKQSRSTTTLPTSATDSDEKIILVQFDEGDPENPKNWSSSRKWLTTILLNVMTLAIGLSTTAYSSGIDTMVAEFGVSTELGQLGLFMFNVSWILMLSRSGPSLLTSQLLLLLCSSPVPWHPSSSLPFARSSVVEKST